VLAVVNVSSCIGLSPRKHSGRRRGRSYLK
jgi:hypothetical protein